VRGPRNRPRRTGDSRHATPSGELGARPVGSRVESAVAAEHTTGIRRRSAHARSPSAATAEWAVTIGQRRPALRDEPSACRDCAQRDAVCDRRSLCVRRRTAVAGPARAQTGGDWGRRSAHLWITAARADVDRTRVRRPPAWTARTARRTWPTWSRRPPPATPTTGADRRGDRGHAHLGEFDAAVSAEARGSRRRGRGRRPGRDPLLRAARPRRRGARRAAGGRGGGARGRATSARRRPLRARGCWCRRARAADPRTSTSSVRPTGRARGRGRRGGWRGGRRAAALHLERRAVCLSHRAVLANRAQAAALRPAPVTPVDRVLLAQPLFHAYGLAAGCSRSAGPGATAVLPVPGGPTPRSWPTRSPAPGQRTRRRAVDLSRAARPPARSACAPRWPACGCARAAGCRCRGRGRRRSRRRPGTASSRATA
jgi:hypothetical protein